MKVSLLQPHLSELHIQSGIQSIWYNADSQGACAAELHVHVASGAQLSLAIVGAVHPRQKISIHVDRGASCMFLFISHIAADAQHEIVVDLAETSACATIRCFPLVWPRITYSFSLTQLHHASSTQSDCITYAVLQKDAQARVLPFVFIPHGCEHARVLSRVDIMKNGTGSCASIYPRSTIQSPDTHFVHGAAVGVVDATSVRALRMAGVDEACARALLIYGRIMPHVQLMVCDVEQAAAQVWLEPFIKNFCCAE